MIYPNKNGVAIMGKGLIANALRRIEDKLPAGVYFFNSPSSIVLFDKELEYCMRETINDFLNVLDYCKKHDMYLIYPSSATVYNKNTSYAKCKAALEEIASAYPVKSLGLRIAAGYGPGEAHKGEHASVVYQWTKQMMCGERPIIFGDGTQTRDFIYEEDIAWAIRNLAVDGTVGIRNIGTGINTSFNEVVKDINSVLGTNIVPVYVPKPQHYVEETRVEGTLVQFDLLDGIRDIYKSL